MSRVRQILKPPRPLGPVLVALLAVCALLACPKYASLSSANYRMPLDALVTSPEEPIELCGMDEVTAFLEWLRCANGAPVFTSGERALDSLDRDYESKNAKGRRVVRYKPSCYLKVYELYVAPEACEDGRKPNVPFTKPKAKALPTPPEEGGEK